MFQERKLSIAHFVRRNWRQPTGRRARRVTRLSLEVLEDRSLLSLVAAFDFNEGGGLAARDASGNGNSGTISGASYVSEGRYGGAISFAGSGDWVTVADAGSLDLTTAMTLEAWVKPTDASSDWTTVLLKERPAGLAYALYAADDAGQPPAGYIHREGVDINVAGNSTLPLNAWSHLAVTYDGAAFRLYVNGTQAASRSQSGSIAVSDGPLRIGGNSVWGEHFAGLIDEVRVYNHALSVAEVQADRDNPIGNTPDTTPPTAALTAPADGATVSGTVTLSATASDNVAVAGVQFVLDGANLGPEDTEAPYATPWNAVAATSGAHTLTAVARDTSGNLATASAISVTVSNAGDVTPPAVAISSPANDSTVSGVISLAADASDNRGVVGVQFVLDGSPLGAEDMVAPYSASWNTNTVPNGTHTLAAVARDEAGNSTVSSAVTVTVSNRGGVPLTIDGAKTFQTIDGFGVNVNINSWNAGELAPALDLLVDDLGSSLFRVYIDNTDWETTNDDADPLTFNWDYYNALYSTPRFEEAWGTIGHLNARGITDGLILNFMGPGPEWMGGASLVAAQEDEWVEMVLSYVVFARQNRGLDFHKLAPFNEADWNGQEGILVDPAQMARVLAKMAERLDAVGLGDIRFVAPEGASAFASVQNYMPELLANPTVMAKLDQFGFHNYAGDSAGARERIAASAYPDREFWITEQSFGNGGAFDGVNNLLRHLEDGASATLVFKAVDGQDNHHPPGDDSALGLLGYDDATGMYSAKPELARMRHFHKFIRPGAVRLGAHEDHDGLRVAAFADPVTGQLTVVGRNTGSGSLTIDGQLLNLPNEMTLEFYQTTLTEPFGQQPTVSVRTGAFTATIAGNSLFTLVSQGQSASPTIKPGLVAAYGLDEGQGTTVGDASGNGLNGSITDATWISGGRFGGALAFNGASSWVTTNDDNALDLTTALTIEAWVHPTDVGGWRTVVLKESGSEEAYALYASHEGLSPLGAVRIDGSYDIAAGGAPLPINSWSHLASTYDGQMLRLYVNGAQVGSAPAAGVIDLSGGVLRIGGNAIWGEYFAGFIDEVRIYSRALTEPEIEADMNTPIGGGAAPTVVANTTAIGGGQRDLPRLSAWLAFVGGTCRRSELTPALSGPGTHALINDVSRETLPGGGYSVTFAASLWLPAGDWWANFGVERSAEGVLPRRGQRVDERTIERLVDSLLSDRGDGTCS